MERLKNMKENLVSLVQSQISGNLANVDAKELGEAVDMIKDLAEAMYYCSVVEAMEESGKEKETRREEHHHHYTEKMIPYEYQRDMDRQNGRMYYPMMYPYDEPIMYYNGSGSGGGGGRGGNSGGSGGSGNSGSSRGNSGSGGQSSGGNNARGGGSRGYSENDWESYPMKVQDYREGKSPMSRKMYMEAKELHKGKEVQMKELEKYVKELGQDVTEMIQDASPEEKQILKQKITELAGKIG